ncbi:MAG: phosphoribosyltransferase domain-containing protein [Odoribacter sp.]|nr:phosphoribosyltransferase domain-containing protein [Odoribacter sp.]
MNTKDFEQVRQRFTEVVFDEPFDLIVAVANGGVIPAAILNQRLNLDLQLLKLHLRDAGQKQLYDRPRLLEEISFEVKGKRILLVEDRVKTGTTLNYARELLLGKGAAVVKTFAVNGNADYCLYNEACFRFPWRTD